MSVFEVGLPCSIGAGSKMCHGVRVRIQVLLKFDSFPTPESVGCTETVFGVIQTWFCIKK